MTFTGIFFLVVAFAAGVLTGLEIGRGYLEKAKAMMVEADASLDRALAVYDEMLEDQEKE